MTWTTPKTWVANTVLYAADLNTHMRDNMQELAPAKATTAGSIFVTEGINRIVERTPDFAEIHTAEMTGSTSWTNLFTTGPSLTIRTGGSALFFISASVKNTASNATSLMSVEVSGSSDINPSDDWAFRVDGITENNETRYSSFHYERNLTPGMNTFTMKYKAGSGMATFAHREMVVFPF